MELNSNQTKTELRDWQGSQPSKNYTWIYSAGSSLGREQECVYMDCQDSKKERKGRKEGSMTVDISGLQGFVLILPIIKLMPHSR